MKVLLVGNIWKSYNQTTDECRIRDALKALGHEVFAYNWPPGRPGYKEIFEDKPKVDFTLVAKRADATHIRELREFTQAPVFYWCFDLMVRKFPGPEIIQKYVHFRAALEADGYFSPELFSAYKYREAGCKFCYLPADAASPIFEKAGPLSEKQRKKFGEEYPVLFTGMRYVHAGGVNRPQLLLEIQEKIKPVPLYIHGYNWKDWQAVGFPHGGGARFDANYPPLIANAKINLAISGDHAYEGVWSNRTSLILSCGGFILAKFTLGRERAFGPDKENLVYWSTTDECAHKIRYYLKHEDERKEIAERGYQFAKRYLSFDYRVRQLLTILKYQFGVG